MADPLSYRRGQRKPWGSVPRINEDHPLARGLISYAYDVGSGPIDLVRGGQRIITGAGALSAANGTKFGPALRTSGSSSTAGPFALPGGPVIEGITVAAPYSYGAGFMLTALPGSGFSEPIFGTCSTTTNMPCGFGTDWNGAGDLWFDFGGAGAQFTATGVISANVFSTAIGVALTGSTTACYVNGALNISPAVTTTLSAVSGAAPAFLGMRSQASQPIAAGCVFWGGLWKRALTASEARLLHDDPWCFLIYPEDELFDAEVGVNESTGTLDATEALDTAAFVGSVLVSGTLAATEALDTAAFVGSVVVSGTLAATEALDTAAFAGSVGVSGTLAATEALDVAAFAGTVGTAVAGTLAATEAQDSAAFAGSVTGIAGTLAATGALDAAAFVGSVLVSGTLAATGAIDVAAFAGTTTTVSSGALAATETGDVAAFAGNITGLVGSMVANEIGVGITNTAFPSNSAIGTPIGDLFVTGIDTAAFDGFVGVSGVLAATEVLDTASFAGNLPDVITGTLAANEAGVSLTDNTFEPNSPVNTFIGTLSVVGVDTAAFNGAVGDNGILAATEAQDTALFIGAVGVNGVLAATEVRDDAAFTAVLGGASGTLAATDIRDTAAFIGTVVIAGTLAATDVRDTAAAFNGTVGGAFGPFAASEAADIALFNGRVGTAGQLDATDAQDTAAFDGTLTGVAGTLVATGTQDIAAFDGVLIEVFGTLAETDAKDIAAFSGSVPLVELLGTLAATEPIDVAAFFGGPIVESAPADFENWKFGQRFDRSLTRRFPWQDSGSRML